ncbi:MAG: hypothetical protein F6K52_21480 [Moorea sp. SIO3H5]|nr:hypothetical protein [Moorena sp. SIO3H5]
MIKNIFKNTLQPQKLLFSDSRFPIPDSRFPIPDSQFLIPDLRLMN